MELPSPWRSCYLELRSGERSETETSLFTDVDSLHSCTLLHRGSDANYLAASDRPDRNAWHRVLSRCEIDVDQDHPRAASSACAKLEPLDACRKTGLTDD